MFISDMVVGWLSAVLVFSLFMRLGGFFLLIRPLAFPITSIYLSDTSGRLECSLEFCLDSFIKHLVLKVQLSVSADYLSEPGWIAVNFFGNMESVLLIKRRDGVKFLEHGL